MMPWLLVPTGCQLPCYWICRINRSLFAMRKDFNYMYLCHFNIFQSLIKEHQIPKLKCFLSCLTVVFAQSTESRCYVENEDVVGASPTGDAPTTSGWSTTLLCTKMTYIRGLMVHIFSNINLALQGLRHTLLMIKASEVVSKYFHTVTQLRLNTLQLYKWWLNLLIWRSGTRRCNLRVANLQGSCMDLI